MDDVFPPQPPAQEAEGVVVEALSREDGKTSTVRVYRDRIEWIKQQTISSLPRTKRDPPVIPLSTVSTVRTRKDGPLFSKVQLRTASGPIVFRMYTPQAVEVRDVIAALLAEGPPEMQAGAGAVAAPASPPAAGSADDDLRQLEWLRAEGMLSAEQFEAAKAQLQSG